ncbi:MAG: MmcQ/YjbR family DNA-binding protein [Hyphomicrobiaceae bacterium]
MATGADLQKLALSLDGTSQAPHFDRTAFKVARIFVTLAADGLTANFKFAPGEQHLKCLVAPDIFTPLNNAWGKQGWTAANLAPMTQADLELALQAAWHHALPKPRKKA